MHLKLNLWLILACLGSQQALGAEPNSNVKVAIPRRLEGHTLRISGSSYRTDQKNITIKTLPSRQRIEVLDRDHRIVSDDYTRIEPSTLRNLRKRTFHIGAEIGLGTSLGNTLDKLNLSERSEITGVNLVYRPHALGLFLNYKRIKYSSSRSLDFNDGSNNPLAAMTSNRTGFGFAYEMAPLSSWPLFFSRLHFGFMLGGFWGSYRAWIAEDDVSIQDSATGFGPMGAVQVRMPLGVNLWLTLQEEYNLYHLKMEKLNFNDNVHELNTTVGVGYAF